MHNNYYFLHQLSQVLQVRLQDYTIVSCFSQNKDELIIELNNASESFFIKASLLPEFSCLSFPNQFNRARKNSIDLFIPVLMKKVLSVRQFQNERSFALILENNLALLFKMHGNRANVILLQNNEAVELFKRVMVGDEELKLNQLDRTIDWTREAFEQHRDNLASLYFTFGKWVWIALKQTGFYEKNADERWQEFQQVKLTLEQPKFYQCLYKDDLLFTLFPIGEVKKESSDPIAAINDFFFTYTASNALLSEKATARKQITDQIKAGENYIARNQIKFNELLNDHHYQLWGDLIMAYMHEVKPGMEKVTLISFYDNNPVEIKLKKELNAQKNAEVFYRKAKNQQIEIDKLREAIQIKTKDLEKQKALLLQLENIEDLRTLRNSTSKDPTKTKEKSLPYHEFEFKGYKIWVGRNAESNDELTLKYTFKEDLWLHVKDVPGSHVVIKHQAGKTFPKDVIERAAELAAYNSKRKTETLCAVIFTPKKFVRKRKGDPPGAVVIEKEEVILVEPKL